MHNKKTEGLLRKAAVLFYGQMKMQTLIDNLATDIRIAFPESMGYSVRNLKYMAKFAARFSDRKIVQEVLAQITWYHKVLIHQIRIVFHFPICYTVHELDISN